MPSELHEIHPRPARPAAPELAFDWLERKALLQGQPDDPALADFTHLALETAQALLGEGREHGRLELLAKSLAVARARLLVLETHLDQLYASGNERRIRLALRVVEAARRYYVALLAEHRHACEGGRRTPVRVSVRQAEAVNVLSVGGGP